MGITRMKPSWIENRIPFIVIDYGVKWQLYEPEIFDSNQPWADGPYCPNCDRELEEKIKGFILKRDLWTCPICKENYDKPNGDTKDQVEKKFAAKLGQQGRLF